MSLFSEVKLGKHMGYKDTHDAIKKGLGDKKYESMGGKKKYDETAGKMGLKKDEEKKAEALIENTDLEKAAELVHLMQKYGLYDTAPFLFSEDGLELIKQARAKMAAEDFFIPEGRRFPAHTDEQRKTSIEGAEKLASMGDLEKIADTLGEMKSKAKSNKGKSVKQVPDPAKKH